VRPVLRKKACLPTELGADMSTGLAATAGEAILCPGCGDSVGIFTGQAHGPHIDLWPIAWSPGYPLTLTVCRLCGGPWVEVPSPDGSPQYLHKTASEWPRVYLQSGAWVGWRELGGE
jgi:hypothetical protein